MEFSDKNNIYFSLSQERKGRCFVIYLSDVLNNDRTFQMNDYL